MIRPAVVQRAVRFAILLALVIWAAVSLRGCEKVRIPDQDASMDPRYPGGTTVIVENLAEDAPLERGTDVVYTHEKDGTTYARFGRVQAIAGDEISAADGNLTVNGTPVGPIPIPGDAIRDKPIGAGSTVRVPAGEVLILAINPAEKRYPDSRALGFIPRDRVRGTIRTSFR